MSDNILDRVSPVLIRGVSHGADGELFFSTYAGPYNERQLVYELPFVGKLDTTQTFHFGVSAIAEGGTSELFAKLSYADSAGNTNMAVARIGVTTTYARYEASLVIPSGMTVKDLLLSRGENAKYIKIQPPTLSYGGPVCLASSAHTPYATQDHIMVTYATRASLKVTDDSIKAEVSQRTETDRTVSELSSRLTQTASGLSASISKLSETDKKVNAWFDFEADSAGNPQLKMGSSASPVVGRYTNSGLAYTSRDGTTIMELDASRSATVSDHIEAQDVKLGKWKWIQTQDGAHLTLVWAG